MTIFGQDVPEADPVALIGRRGTNAPLDGINASAISVLDTAGNWTATDVEAVLAELPGRFAPLVPTSIFIPAGSCLVAAGTRTESQDGNIAGFTMASGGTTSVVGTLLVPPGVTSLTVYALWTLISGQSAGDVRHTIVRSTFTSGVANLTGLGTYDPGSDFFVTAAPAATVLAETTYADVTAFAVTAGQLLGLAYIRDGSGVADTAGTTRFFGFRVVANP